MTKYFPRPYSWEPPRFKVEELSTQWKDGSMTICDTEVIAAHDYDELRRAYDHVYESLMEQLRGKPQ